MPSKADRVRTIWLGRHWVVAVTLAVLLSKAACSRSLQRHVNLKPCKLALLRLVAWAFLPNMYARFQSEAFPLKLEQGFGTNVLPRYLLYINNCMQP